MRLFRRREPLLLRFQRREAVLVAQTATLWALHADVRVGVRGRREPVTITNGHLDWETEAGRNVISIARCPWDRAVIEGKYHYPVEALAFAADRDERELTLTFNLDLIKRPDGPPPLESRLVLRLSVSGSERPIEFVLWRVGISTWDGQASLEWLPPGR